MENKIQLPSPLKLDLACGDNKKEGFFGIDIADIPGVDLVMDLGITPWPFEDNSVDEAVCCHFIEHIGDIMKFMNELHRVMKVGAKVTMQAPYYNSVRCWQDPTHIRAISENTFLYYNTKWRTESGLMHYPITADFDVSWTYALDEGWASIWSYMDQNSRDYAVRHYTNVVSDIVVFLKKRDPKDIATATWVKNKNIVVDIVKDLENTNDL